MESEIIHVPKKGKAIEGTIVDEGWTINPFNPHLAEELRNIANLIESGKFIGEITRVDTSNHLIEMRLELRWKSIYG